MKQQHTLKIVQYKTGRKPFMAIFSDPKIRAFLPDGIVCTPYFGDYPADKVLSELKARNPEYIVTLEN